MGNPLNRLASVMTALHARLYRVTDGKVGGAIKGTPVLVVETTGRKSGEKRARPLMKIDHGGKPHIVASNNGSDDHPAWYLNVLANPTVTVTDGGETYEARAVVLEDAERDAAYESAKQQMDNFVGYERKSSRSIPVIRLDRA
jgi:deazaflavin-dependent oxidoreductase (nitroreductase family)